MWSLPACSRVCLSFLLRVRKMFPDKWEFPLPSVVIAAYVKWKWAVRYDWRGVADLLLSLFVVVCLKSALLEYGLRSQQIYRVLSLLPADGKTCFTFQKITCESSRVHVLICCISLPYPYRASFNQADTMPWDHLFQLILAFSRLSGVGLAWLEYKPAATLANCKQELAPLS